MIGRHSGGDPLVYEVPVAMEGGRRSSSPQVYELPVSAGETAQSPLTCEALPAAASVEDDPSTYEVPTSAGYEPTGIKSSGRVPDAPPGGGVDQSPVPTDSTLKTLQPVSTPMSGRGILNRCTQVSGRARGGGHVRGRGKGPGEGRGMGHVRGRGKGPDEGRAWPR